MYKRQEYDTLLKTLKEISPVPIGFEEIYGGSKGYYSLGEQRIAIQVDMSPVSYTHLDVYKRQAIAQVNEEYTEKLEEIQSSFEGSYSRIETDGTLPDWREVLAVFADKVAGSDGEDANEVATFDEDRVERLKKVFWDMVEVWGAVVEVEEGELKVKVLILHIESLSLIHI